MENGKWKVESGKWKVLWILTVVFVLSACSSGTGLESHDAWVRSALKGENSAMYLILHNHTDVNDALLSVTTDVATAVELHLTTVTNDVMSMNPMERIEIPAGDEVEFVTGSYHIMLVDLKQDLKVGDEITVTFDFEHYQDVTVSVPVQESAQTMEHNHP